MRYLWANLAINKTNLSGNLSPINSTADPKATTSNLSPCAGKNGSAISTPTSKKPTGPLRKMYNFLSWLKITDAGGPSSPENSRESAQSTLSKIGTMSSSKTSRGSIGWAIPTNLTRRSSSTSKWNWKNRRKPKANSTSPTTPSTASAPASDPVRRRSYASIRAKTQKTRETQGRMRKNNLSMFSARSTIFPPKTLIPTVNSTFKS